MNTYRVTGTFTRTLRFQVDEEVEAENEDDAIAQVCEGVDAEDAWDTDESVYGLDVELVAEGPAPDVPQGRPLLREKDDREALAAWIAGKPIPGRRTAAQP